MKKLLLILLLSNLLAISPQQWLVEKLGIDQYSLFHYVVPNFYARGMTSVGLWGDKAFSNRFTAISGVVIIVGWEIGQYYNYGGYEEWAKVYGGVDEAWRNTLVDMGLGVFGLYAGLRWKALRKPSIAYFNNQIQIEWRF